MIRTLMSRSDAWLRRFSFQHPVWFVLASMLLIIMAFVALAPVVASAPSWHGAGIVAGCIAAIFLLCVIGATGVVGMMLALQAIDQRRAIKQHGRRIDAR